MTEAHPRMALPERNLFWAQLRAIRRARAAVSRHERQQSPGAWYLERAIIAFIAVVMVGIGAGLGLSFAGSPTVEPGRKAIFLLSGPLVMAVYLVFFQARSARSAHPLGEALLYAPLPRLRSALLRTFDSLVDPANLFLVSITFVPWLAAELAGARWLNATAAVSLVFFAAAIILGRELFAAGYRYLLELTSGIGAAFVRFAIGMVGFAIPLGLHSIGPLFGGESFSPLDLPALRWMRAPLGPVGLFAIAGLCLSLAVWVRARPMPRGITFRRTRSRGIRTPTRASKSAYSRRPAIRAMLRMMIVQAARQPTYRYSAAVLLFFSLVAVAFGGGSNGPVAFFAFGGPLTLFFNLYGADGSYYALWLGSGRTLREWTLARQLFVLVYYTLFGSVGVAVLVGSGTLALHRLPLFLPLFLQAPLIALIAGPAVSRFVVTPQAREIVRAKVAGRSGRSFFAPVASAVTAGLVIAPGLLFIQAGWWPVNYAVLCALAVTAVATRPYRSPWTLAFRERLATAFRM